jgi:hypothetical protein
MCRFGVMFNMGWLIYGDFKAGFELGPWWQRLFNGYSIITWMVVFNLGSSGLLVSWLMKYSDNIVKVRSLRFSAIEVEYYNSTCFNHFKSFGVYITTSKHRSVITETTVG